MMTALYNVYLFQDNNVSEKPERMDSEVSKKINDTLNSIDSVIHESIRSPKSHGYSYRVDMTLHYIKNAEGFYYVQNMVDLGVKNPIRRTMIISEAKSSSILLVETFKKVYCKEPSTVSNITYDKVNQLLASKEFKA